MIAWKPRRELLRLVLVLQRLWDQVDPSWVLSSPRASGADAGESRFCKAEQKLFTAQGMGQGDLLL